jgi:hypothetical protein
MPSQDVILHRLFIKKVKINLLKFLIMITNYVQCRLVLINMYLLTGLSQNPKKRAYIERALQIKFTTKKNQITLFFFGFPLLPIVFHYFSKLFPICIKCQSGVNMK